MAQRLQIQCINKTQRQEPHERIRAVGGFAGGQRWKLSLDDAVARLKSGKYRFYVHKQPWGEVNVLLATSARGHGYLRTEADGVTPDNLLALPECP
jgi:hypothetical protein